MMAVLLLQGQIKNRGEEWGGGAPAGKPSTDCFVRNRFRLDRKKGEHRAPGSSVTREHDGHFVRESRTCIR